MKTLVHQHDPDLKITLAPPSRFEDVYAEWFDAKAAGRDYSGTLDLVRGCAIEPIGDALTELFRIWSGLVGAAWPYIAEMADGGMGEHTLLDPRALRDRSDANASHIAALEKAGVSATMLDAWLRTYPRKGPPGDAQLVLAQFKWGYYFCRAPEPQEWFDVEELRRKGMHFEVSRRLIKSCTLFPAVPDVLARASSAPAIIPILGAMIRTAAGEGLAKLVGE